MLIKPFSILFKDQVEPTAMSYLGLVEDNNDPEKLGRVRVRISPYSEMATKDLPWASPMLGTHGNSAEYGGVNIPELGSQVRVSFPSRDFTAPYYSGAELNQVNRTTFFDEDYPYTYGYKDSVGNFVKVNKERGTAQFQHYTTTNLQVAPDGSIKVGLSNGAYFIFDNGNNFDLSINTVEIAGSADGTLEVDANNEVIVNTGQTTFTGNVTVNGDFTPARGVNGSFMTNGNFITVANGIIVSIE